MMKKYILLLATLLMQVSLFAQDAAIAKEANLPDGYNKQIDVVYKKVPGWEGRMDVYWPGKKSKPAPIVFLIHGGGWRSGNKEAYGGFATYFKLGFAVVNVEYRLSRQGAAPGAVEDVRCAMMYMVNHADSFFIDVNKIVFGGSSAGAHLALMAGLLGSNHQFDADCPVSNHFKIAAIIAQSSPTTLTMDGPNGETKILPDGAIYEWIAKRKDDTAFAKSLSPIRYVSKSNPPILLTHGDADPRVPYQQSVLMDSLLTQAGVKHRFITIPGGGHGGYNKEKQDEIKLAITQFLNENVLN